MIIAGILAPNGYPEPEGGQHITLAYMGNDETDAPDEQVAHLEQLCSVIAEHAEPFEVPVADSGKLGDAYVLHLPVDRIVALREAVVGDPLVTELMSTTEQYPDFTPHMSLAYEDDTDIDLDTVQGLDLSEPLTVIGLSLWTSTGQHDFLFSDPKGVLPVDNDDVPVIMAAAGKWEPGLHPRGKDGKFIEKFGIMKFLDSVSGLWSYGQVVGIDRNTVTNKPEVTLRPSDLFGKPNGKPDVDLPPSKIYSVPSAKAHLSMNDKGVKQIGGQAGSNEGGLYELPGLGHDPSQPSAPAWLAQGKVTGQLDGTTSAKLSKLASENSEFGAAWKVWSFNTPEGKKTYVRGTGAAMIGEVDDKGDVAFENLDGYSESMSSAQLGKQTDVESDKILADLTAKYGDPTYTYDKGETYGKNRPYGLSGYKIHPEGRPVLAVGIAKKDQYKGGFSGADFYELNPETGDWRQIGVGKFGQGNGYIGNEKSLDQITYGLSDSVSVRIWDPIAGKAQKAANWKPVSADPGTASTVKYYIKKAKTLQHGNNEALANALYEEAGVYVPAVDFNTKDGRIYSKIVPGKQDMADKLASKDTEWISKVQANFAVDAWLANWDVFGLTLDNILTDENGEPIRIDNGGALLYRAQGSPKGADFGSKVTELDSMRSGKNKSKIFGSNMPKSAELDGAQRILAITPERVEELVSDHNLPKSLADTLKARRKYIADYYGLPLPETMQPSGSDHMTSAPLVDPLDASGSNGLPRTWSTEIDYDALSAIVEPGDVITTSKGTKITVDSKPVNGLVLAILDGEPFQIKKKSLGGGRPTHNAELPTTPTAAAQLLNLDWQRGDRIEIDGDLLDVIGVNRTKANLVVAPVGTNNTFSLNALNLPGDKVVTKRWDPEAATDTLPEPSQKTGMAVEIETALKNDLVQPLPQGAPPKPSKASATPGDGIGEPKKNNVKSMVVGDGTTAATGDKVISKKDGKEWIFVKPKGYSAVVYSPDDPDKKQYMKTASTLFQPGKEPVVISGVDTPKPTSSNGIVPQLGMTVTAKDGKTGKISWISPDGKSLQFKQDGNPKPIKKTTMAISIEKGSEPAPEPSLVAPGEASPGTPGLPNHTYGKMELADPAQIGDVTYVSPENLTPGKTLVWVATPEGNIRAEKWANQPTDSLLVVNKKIAAYGELNIAAFPFTADELPTLDEGYTYRLVYAGKRLSLGSSAGISQDGTVTAYDYDGHAYNIPAGAPMLASVSTQGWPPKASGTVIDLPLYQPSDSSENFTPLSKLLSDSNFSIGATISPDGTNWYTITEADPGETFLILETPDGDPLFLSKKSMADFILHPAPATVSALEETGPAGISAHEAPEFSLVTSTVSDAVYMKLGSDLYMGKDKVGTTSSLGSNLVTVNSDLSEAAVNLDFSQLQALFAANLTGVVEVNGKQYQTYGVVTGPDYSKHFMLRDIKTGTWVDGDISLLGGDISFTLQGPATDMWPAEADPLLNSITEGKAWVTPKDVSGTGKMSPQTLIESLGPDFATPVDIYMLNDKLLRWGPNDTIEKWDPAAKKWSTDPDHQLMPTLSATKVIDGKGPGQILMLGSGFSASTMVTPKHNHMPIYNIKLSSTGEMRTAYKKGTHYHLLKQNGSSTLGYVEAANTLGEPELVYDPWGTEKKAVAPVADEGPKFYPPGWPTPLLVTDDNKVVEFSLPDGSKAYAVKEYPHDPTWDIYGGSGVLPSILNDKSMDQALSGTATLYSAKIVHTGKYSDQAVPVDTSAPATFPAPDAVEAPYTFGKQTFGPGTAIYTVSPAPDTELHWVKEPGKNKWVVYWPDSEYPAFNMTDTEFHNTLQAYKDLGLTTKLVYGKDEPKTLSFNGYVPQDGDQVAKLDGDGYTDIFYVKPAGKDVWYGISSTGSVSPIGSGFSSDSSSLIVVHGAPAPVDTKPEDSISGLSLTHELVVPTEGVVGTYVNGGTLQPEDLLWLNKLTSKHPIPAGAIAYTRPGWKHLLVERADGTHYKQESGWVGGWPEDLDAAGWSKYMKNGQYKQVNLKSLEPAEPVTKLNVVSSEWESLDNYSPVTSLADILPGSYLYSKKYDSWVHVTEHQTPGVVKYDSVYDSYAKSWISPTPYTDAWTLPNDLDDLTYWNQSSAPKATPAAPPTPAAPEAKTVPGVTVADEAAKISWGGELTKTGHVPYPGMSVTGIKGLSGKIISINKDKTKATVLAADGTKTTRLIKALKSNTSANYAAHLGPVTPTEIPEGMEVPYDTPSTVFGKVFADTAHIGGLINSHPGVKNAATVVKSAKAPNGKMYARVHFTMTTEQRAAFLKYLEGNGEPPKMGAWVGSGSKALTDLAPGDVVALRNSSSQSEWVLNKSANAPTHKLVEIKDDGTHVFEDLESGGTITTPFTKKASSSQSPYMAQIYTWDDSIAAPVQPSSYSSFKGLSDHAKAVGWQWKSSGAVVPSANAANGTISSNPENWPSSTHIDGATGGAKLQLADGTVIDVVSPQTKQHSEAGIVVISVPEGGDAVAAYSAAMSALQMEHAPMTQENVKSQVRPMLVNMLSLDMSAPDSAKGWSDEKIFSEIGKAVEIPDVGWDDVRIGVHADQGRTEFLWSQRVIDAMTTKSSWKNVVRGGKSYDKVFDVIRYGAMDATTRRVLGLPGAGNGHGSDSANNAGHGSFMSGGFADKFATKNLINTNYGGGYAVYHRPEALFARIGDIRPGKGSHDAFGAGQGNGSNAFTGMLNQSSSWDLWMAGGLPVDTIGWVVMNNESQRKEVLDKLHAAGYHDLNGRPIEEVIQTASALNAAQSSDALPPYAPQNTVDLSSLPIA